MRIREATVEDAPAIARVTVDTWKTAYRGIIDDNYLDSLTYAEREKGWRGFPFNEAFVLAAEDAQGNIIGFAAGGPQRDEDSKYKGELYAIYIYQEHQREGIGQALFESFSKKLAQTGVDSLMLWVLSDSPYRQFYEKLDGRVIESKLLEMDGFTNQITAYGWPDITAISNFRCEQQLDIYIE